MLGCSRRWISGLEKCRPGSSSLVYISVAKGLETVGGNVVSKLVQKLLIRQQGDVIAEADEDGSSDSVAGVCTRKCHVRYANSNSGYRDIDLPAQQSTSSFQNRRITPHYCAF